MYSVVLAAMLTTTPATPSFGWGCKGCCSCWGCSGCSCSGCWGCHGCHGCWGCHGCHGCYGCGGYCGGWSCYGSSCSCYGGCFGCHGCSAYYGCHSCYGCTAVAPAVVPVPKKRMEGAGDTSTSEQAKVILQVPEDATLYIDGQRTPLTSATRTFVTPALAPKQNYYYDVRVEALRDGKVLEQSRRIVVRAGSVAQITLDNLEQVTTTAQAAPARLTVRLPEEARLFVDGQACPLTSSPRSFDTPRLEGGRKFYYTLKAEMVRDGQTLVESQRVVVEAGKKVDVTFENLSPAGTTTASR